MEKKNNSWAQLWRTEDWLAVWIGFIIIALGCMSVLTGAFDFSAFNFKTWGWGEAAATNVTPLGVQMSSPSFWTKLLLTFAVLGILFTAGARLLGEKAKKYFPAFIGVFVLGVIVRLISAEFTLNRYLEWAFWALIVGLLVSNTVGVPKWLKPAVKTEFYIKAGLVVMGFSVLFSNIAKFGLYGLGISWIVCPLCIIFMWWFGTKVLKIKNKPLVITLASATSVCGTSAAIATGAAAKCKKTDLTVAVSISIIASDHRGRGHVSYHGWSADRRYRRQHWSCGRRRNRTWRGSADRGGAREVHPEHTHRLRSLLRVAVLRHPR